MNALKSRVKSYKVVPGRYGFDVALDFRHND